MKIIGLCIAAIGLLATLYLRFSNPEMTETQLFIKYWPDFIVAVVLMVYGFSLGLK